MLHRAILGSFERFLGILIEHYAGRFPLWLAPVQAVVATIVSDADAYAGEVAAALRAGGAGGGARPRPTRRSTPRCASTAWRMCRCWRWSGGKEAESGTVALRRLGGEAQEVLPLDEAVRAPCAEATPPDLSGEPTRHRLEARLIRPDCVKLGLTAGSATVDRPL